MAEEIAAIQVADVSKQFKLPHEKAITIKGLVTGSARRGKKSKPQQALQHISLDIAEGEFFGIVGRNGSGKSTLLKILAGIYQPTAGKVNVRGKLVPFIELGVGFNPELTGCENVYLNGALLGFSRKEIDAFYGEVVEFAELEEFMDQKLKNYSSGMQVRLAFSMAIRADADILLIDEVLAVGDADFQRKCYDYFKQLKKNKKTVVFVSHDMAAVREFCDRAALIEKHRIQDVGDPLTISKQYSLLFIEEMAEGDKEAKKKGKSVTRWGDGRVQTTTAKAEKDGDAISIKQAIKVKQDVDKIVYGLHIFGADGLEITAMNNRMIQLPDIDHGKKGQEISLEWQVLNIFNDGKYSVTLTLVDEVGDIMDWYVDAANFSIKRSERSTTAVLPPIKVIR